MRYIQKNGVTLVWRLAGSGDWPPARQGATLTYLSGHLLLFGGYGADGRAYKCKTKHPSNYILRRA